MLQLFFILPAIDIKAAVNENGRDKQRHANTVENVPIFSGTREISKQSPRSSVVQHPPPRRPQNREEG